MMPRKPRETRHAIVVDNLIVTWMFEHARRKAEFERSMGMITIYVNDAPVIELHPGDRQCVSTRP